MRAPLAASTLCDVAAGAALAGGFEGRAGHLLMAGATSLCLYAGGMILNGVVDIEADRQCVPSRPLPRGEISLRSAILALVGLLVGALLLALGLGPGAWLLTLAILILIVLYHLAGKRHFPGGVICLGLIRALNMGLGLVTFASVESLAEPTRWAPVGAYGLYAGAVSTIAAMEDGEVHPWRFRWALGLALAVLLGASFLSTDRAVDWRLPLSGTIASACFVVLVLGLRPAPRRSPRRHVSLRAVAGLLLMGFYIFDAAVAAGAGRAQIAAAILLAFIVGRWAARSMSPS